MLRTRVVASVDEGHGHREAARHFRVSPKCVNDLVKLRCETWGLDAETARQWRRTWQAGGGDRLAQGPRHGQGRDHARRTGGRTGPKPGIAGHRAIRPAGVARARADTQEKPCRPLNKSARTWLACAMSGSRGASPSWPTLWSGWRSSMVRREPATGPGPRRTRSRQAWRRPPAGHPAGSASSIMHRPGIGGARPSLPPAPCPDREAPWVIDER